MATVRERLLPILYRIRTSVLDTKLGFRRFRVFLRRTTPSDGVGGVGATWTSVDVELTEKPKIRAATANDEVRSGGRVTVGMYFFEKVTPRDDADTVGTKPADLDIRPNAAGQKVFIVLVGPDMPTYVASPPSGGGEFTLAQFQTTGNFQFSGVLVPVTGKRDQ